MNTSSYQQQQHLLYNQIEKDFKKGLQPSAIVSIVQDYKNDNRIGLTTVSFLPENIQKTIQHKIIKHLTKADPGQYYYPPPNSLHLTILCIRVVNDPVLFTKEDVETISKVFEKEIPKHKKIKFKLKGLFELPTSIGIRAYCDDSLQKLIKDLRKKLSDAHVPENKKLASNEIFFSNVTFCRLISKPSRQFENTIKKLKNIEIGEVEVSEVILATSNVTFQPNKTTIISRYQLQ